MTKKPEKQLTNDLSQTEVVTIAVYLLGGGERAVDTEDVAAKAHSLAPGRFSWRKYPDQINLELIRVYLSDAKKATKGRLLLGSGRAGWRLTQNGLKWVQKAVVDFDGHQVLRKREQSRAGSIDEQRWRRERSRILSSKAWKQWISGTKDIPEADIKEVFRIDSYALGDLREAKITRVRSLFAEDKELQPFLDHVANKFIREGTI